MRAFDVALSLLVVASLSVNGWLLARSDSATESTTTEQPSSEAKTASASRRRSTVPPQDRPCNRALLACEAIVADCEAAMRACEGSVEELSPPSERFDLLPPGKHRALRYLLALEDLFAEIEGIQHEVECRDLVCRVDLAGEDEVLSLATKEMQVGHPGNFTVGNYFGDSGPDGAMRVWVDVLAPELEPGRPILRELVETFDESDARERCWQKHGTRGELLVMVRLIPDRGIEIQVAGTLEREPIGKCLKDALQALADETELPDRFTGAREGMRIRMPPGEPHSE
jgi:hypothetical protein